MESSPQYEDYEAEPKAVEYILDPSYYRHLPVEIAQTLAAENGLEVRVIKRDGIFLGEGPGHNLRRLNFTVMDGIVTSVRLG